MLLVTSKSNNIYTILDTDDMTSDTISKEELLPFLQAGNIVYGETAFALEYNLKSTLILRLYGSDKTDVKDYDGYLLRDYCSEYNEYTTQIIDSIDFNKLLLNLDVWKILCDAIREINPCPYNLDYLENPLEMGYKVYASVKDSLTLKDLSDGELYSCDFFTCLFIYLEEHKGIEGLEYISKDSLLYYSTHLTAKDVLDNYWVSSSVISKSNKILDGNNFSLTQELLEADYDELEGLFGGRDALVVDFCYIPIYNVKRNMQVVNQSGMIPYFIQYDVAYKLEGKHLFFKNGKTLDSFNEIARLYKHLRYESDELKQQVFSAVENHQVRAMTLNQSFDLEKLSKKCVSNNSDFAILKPLPFHPGVLPLDDFIGWYRTPFGDFQVNQVDYNDCTDVNYENIWMLRVTQTGSCAYSFKEYKVISDTMKNISNKGTLSNDMYKRYMELAQIKDISYCQDLITPLCIDKIEMFENSILISLACVIRKDYGVDDFDEIATTNINIVSIPLIFTDGNFTEYDDCFVYRCLFQTIYLEKSLVHSLYGSVYDSQSFSCWESTSRKADRELSNRLDKATLRTMKKVFNI